MELEKVWEIAKDYRDYLRKKEDLLRKLLSETSEITGALELELEEDIPAYFTEREKIMKQVDELDYENSAKIKLFGGHAGEIILLKLAELGLEIKHQQSENRKLIGELIRKDQENSVIINERQTILSVGLKQIQNGKKMKGAYDAHYEQAEGVFIDSKK